MNVSGFIKFGMFGFADVYIHSSCVSSESLVEDLCSENTIFFYNQPVVNLQMTGLSSSKLPAEKSVRVPQTVRSRIPVAVLTVATIPSLQAGELLVLAERSRDKTEQERILRDSLQVSLVSVNANRNATF